MKHVDMSRRCLFCTLWHRV